MELRPNKRTSAVCGLFCQSCAVYIATKEEPERLKNIAQTLNQTVEESRCEGCRANVKSLHCKTCETVSCASQRGVEFCSECEDYPCEALKEFQAKMPHRKELWDSLQKIKEHGYERWYYDMIEHYLCLECHTLNSAYDVACRKCGASPSCSFVNSNMEAIQTYLNKK